MSKATKRKHVTKEVLDDYVVPDNNQEIVKVLGGRGNNLHEVQNSEGKQFLVSMPSKFRRNVWIKRGDFVIVETIEEGNKVCAEIVHILYSKQIKYLKEEKLWPDVFTDKAEKPNEQVEDKVNGKHSSVEQEQNGLSDESDEDCDDDLFVNTNRPPVLQCSDESESEEEDDDDDDEQDK